MRIAYAPAFIRQFEHLPEELQNEALEKIDLLKDLRNHRMLKMHKLHGRFKGRWSFSVNYKTRIVFSYESKDEAVLLAIGDHDIYR